MARSFCSDTALVEPRLGERETPIAKVVADNPVYHEDMPLGARQCIMRYYRIDRREIHYLKFVLEGYDGVAVMRTLDPQAGLVVLHVAPGCEDVVDTIIDDLKGCIRIEGAGPPSQRSCEKGLAH
jgi:hypothetical protein